MSDAENHAEQAALPLTWLIQANMRDQALRQKLEAALDALGEHHYAVALVPFSREIAKNV